VNEIDQVAGKVLADDPDPVVRFRLLRDVMRLDMGGSAKHLGAASRWVRLLEQSQHADGGWGRFHSADTRARTSIPTTEFAIDRALALGLDAEHPVVERAIGYLTALLLGRVEFPDRAERNDRWIAGTQLFVAGTMARMVPNASELDEIWGRWATILERTFASGGYDPVAEARAHRDIGGASVTGSYLILSNRYSVALLGARARDLPARTVRRYADWLWSRPEGIGYLTVCLSRPPGAAPSAVDRWLTSVELLAPFPSPRWGRAIEWLWSRRPEDGLWDFGSRWARSAYLPLSEDWRRRGRRVHDHSTRVLTLLRLHERSG